MPLLIIGIIILLLFPKRPRIQRTRRIVKAYSAPKIQTTLPAVVDPVKLQREQDRQRREQDRIADRARREAERLLKEAERQRKEQAERLAANDRLNWLDSMIDRYAALSAQIENELESNPTLTAYKTIQLQKQLLTIEEKTRRFQEQKDKQYYIINGKPIESETE